MGSKGWRGIDVEEIMPFAYREGNRAVFRYYAAKWIERSIGGSSEFDVDGGYRWRERTRRGMFFKSPCFF